MCMIECSCQVLTTKNFNDAVAAHRPEIEAAGSLKKAVGVVYNAARFEKNTDYPHKACTTCLPSLATRIQEAGFYQDETFPVRSRFEEPVRQCGKAGPCCGLVACL